MLLLLWVNISEPFLAVIVDSCTLTSYTHTHNYCLTFSMSLEHPQKQLASNYLKLFEMRISNMFSAYVFCLSTDEWETC